MNTKVLIVVITVFIILLPILGFPLTLAEQAKEYREKGYQAQQAGSIEDAISYYQKAVSLDLNYAAPHNDLGIIYEAKGWLDRAEEEYKKALVIDPDYAKAHTNLALLYERKGEVEKAAFHWMKRYRLGSPEDTWTIEAKQRLEKLGLIDKEEPRLERPVEREVVRKKVEPSRETKKEVPKLKEKTQPKREIKEPKREIKAEKEEPPPSKWTRIGEPSQRIAKEQVERPTKKKSVSEDLRKKQLEASLKLAEQRLREEKRKGAATTEKSARKYYNDAQNFYQNGEYVRALDSLRKAKEISPDDHSIYELENEIKIKMKQERISDHYNEGMRYFQQKNFTKAKEEFEAILSILPE